MDREINLESIRALEKQIGEHEGNEKAVIQLKRSRNSLLNISILLPPEILGSIFHWNVIPSGDFAGLEKGSYNFLLVCHHWFEVASRTPELWSFWGNSIEDWTHRHTRCGSGPVDVALNWNNELGDELRDALRDCAARGVIRRICLRSAGGALISSIISAIVIEGEGAWSNSMESFKVMNYGWSLVDISAFFSRYHLPKLRSLCLFGCRISSWGLLKSQTTALTTLSLTVSELSPVPTPSQLLSILSFSPLLRDLALIQIPGSDVIGSDAPTIRVQLRHLRQLFLSGNFRGVFTLLNLLEVPDKIDSQQVDLHGCSLSCLSQTLGPYFGDRVQRRDRVPGVGIGLLVEHSQSTFHLRAGDTRVGHDPAKMIWFAEISAVAGAPLEDEEADRLCFDLIAHVQREQVTSLRTNLRIPRWEELCVEMRNLTHLHLLNIDLSTWFAELGVHKPQAPNELLRGLKHIEVTGPLPSGDWSPLTKFLSHRAAIGNRISSLKVRDHPHMNKDVVASIERTVDIFECG